MRDLSSIEFPQSINTGNESAIDAFFSPSLKNATEYCVAVAYFSSAWISEAAPGLADFVSSGGRLRWMVSPQLSADDIEAINSSSSENQKAMIAWNNLERILFFMEKEPREILTWMIADQVLELRLAIPRKTNGSIFHAKIGYLSDPQGYKVAFSGSYNITGAANRNWERIDIFSYKDEPKRVDSICAEWEALWGDSDPHTSAIKVTDEIMDRVRKSISMKRPYHHQAANDAIPQEKHALRDYQIKAINSWFDNKGKGVLVMATGSGKTFTALKITEKLLEKYIERKTPIVVIIAVPYRHLLEQWSSEASEHGIDLVKCFESKSTWLPLATSRLADLRLGTIQSVVLGVTYATLARESFQTVISSINCHTLFIADEAHNVLADTTRRSLPENATFRLGLTATPERNSEPGESTELLEEYFGKVIFEFGIEDAIKNRYLTPYKYYAIPCTMSDLEFDRYTELTQRIYQLMNFHEDSQKEDSLKRLLMERARVVGDLDSKYEQLKTNLSKIENRKTLIYCSDYSDSSQKPIERAMKIASSSNLKMRKFTHTESMKERADIIRLLESGRVDTVVAIRCLDEGVDIPSVDSAHFLASSTSHRQFIQRRGRVLRLAPSKTHSYIYDYVALPPEGTDHTDLEKKASLSLIKRERDRVEEFSRIALNFQECDEFLKNLERLEKNNEPN
ncbi:MAG: DEAD/DEAH box helicase family protein [Alcanivoracaceae bacterium]|nr:DEAD/DEAH box helicase family protein [Alcanivoracaceae bacterium]